MTFSRPTVPVKPVDPLGPIKDFLGDELDMRVVKETLPTDWTPEASGPVVVIADDSGPMRWPVATKPLVRVTAWGRGRTQVVDLAGTAIGLLLCKPIDGIASVTPGTAVVADRDGKTGGWFATFAVNTTVRTAEL